MTTFTHVGTFQVITCYKCSVQFGMPKGMYNARRDDHNCFYCPSGHGQYFSGKSETEKLQASLEYQKRMTQYERAAKESARRSNAAIKGHQTRLKRRIANGVCPCCSRTFKDLEQHMANQHPEYETSNGYANE